jgi:hypothetical protein
MFPTTHYGLYGEERVWKYEVTIQLTSLILGNGAVRVPWNSEYKFK